MFTGKAGTRRPFPEIFVFERRRRHGVQCGSVVLAAYFRIRKILTGGFEEFFHAVIRKRGKSLFYRIFRFLEILKIIAVVSAEGFSERAYIVRGMEPDGDSGSEFVIDRSASEKINAFADLFEIRFVYARGNIIFFGRIFDIQRNRQVRPRQARAAFRDSSR